MGNDKKGDKFNDLRTRAEKLIAENLANLPKPPAEDIQKIFHELNVYQIELEMQNEELLKTQDKLMESIRRFTDLYDFAPVGYFTCDEKGTILEANLTLASLLGITRVSLIGKSFHNFVISKDRDILYLHLKDIFTSKGLQRCEMRLLCKERQEVYAQIESIVVKDLEKGIPVCRSSVVDITERKKLEELLLQARKMEAVGQLAGGIAHDFNNLLTAIVGYGNLLKTEMDNDSLLMPYITRILESAERAANLTKGLLAFSRRQIISPKPLNLNECIKEVGKLLSGLLGEDIELSIILTDKDLIIIADRSQIEQVLMNLATNARDAMPDGGTLTIRTEFVEFNSNFIKAHGYGRPGPYALISVEDTGIGMDEETKDRIFEPFFTTKEVGKGTGLGLSMVYGIIKEHDGYISVYSEPGKGTTFRIYLRALPVPTLIGC